MSFKNYHQILEYILHLFFCNLNQLQQDNVYAVHQFANSWIDTSDRGLVFKLCKKYALMGAYHKIERIIRKLKS